MQRAGMLVLLVLMLAGCQATPSADVRFRQCFQSPQLAQITPDAARQALLAQLPPGTPEPAIYDYLRRNGVGQDSQTRYFPANEQGRIFCNVEDDPRRYNLFGSKQHHGYSITFLLDPAKRLTDVQVQAWEH